MENDVLLTKNEFLEQFLLSEGDISKLIKEGLPVIKVERRLMFPKEDCHRFFRGEIRKGGTYERTND